MTRPRPDLAGTVPAAAAAFARARVAAWRRTCRGPARLPRFSLVRCADIESADHVGEDVSWWDGAEVLTSPDVQGRRIDVALRLVAAQRDTPVVAVWSRVGPPDLQQSDQGWAAAVRHAADDRGVHVPSLLVVTRWGWLCLPAGTRRTWKRLRT